MIEDVFLQLKGSGLVQSANEFSRIWLGMEESYFRCMRSRGSQPSAKALARCAHRLRQHGEALSESKMPSIQLSGAQLRSLADQCFQEILEVSVQTR